MLTDKDIRARRKTMFRVGITLGHVMESTALNPGNLMFGMAIHKNPNISMVENNDRILKLDAVKDLQPLANIHNILTQFKGCTLTSESIKDAEILASKMPFSEARQALIELRQAYDLQTPIHGHRPSKARELPPITKFAMEEWHRGYLSHAATTGILIINASLFVAIKRKLFQLCKQSSTRPISQRLSRRGGEENQQWIEEDKMAFDAATHLADSMTVLCKNIPLPRFVKPNPQTETQLPIYTQFKVHPRAQEDFQEFQKILGQIYSLFEKNSCSALAIISKGYYTKEEKCIKIMAADQKRFSRKYLNAASYFFNSLRQIKAVVFENQSRQF
ncbi:hypothetical protein L873DRAFT_1845124 [Choiromyces venosus 120613-1]|uniref:Uncharacterized protein n=1 Tax=Choiromyces venosus 120613-1 TaxID=1336337 RepID=A0A3N4JIN5_9PEZI|nr:hypothetical protein L873DRAFT_1845124 [Choiromyces venosus 120613-1]